MLIISLLFFYLGCGGSKTEKQEVKTESNPWAEKDNEVVEIVKRCRIPGTEGNILQLTAGHLETAKRQGTFIEFEGWCAFQVSGPVYETGVGYKVNGASKTAK